LIIIPAIDLIQGQIVRLQQGNTDLSTDYSAWGTPQQVARKWQNLGASALHVIDLDAAVGRGNNRAIVEKIQKTVQIPLQFGGGLRSRSVITSILQLGIQRVILGTFAFEQTNDFQMLLRQFGPDRFVVALDYLHTQVMIRGWQQTTEFHLDDALTHFLNLNVDTFLLTSISNDGLLSGPDYTLLERIVKTQPNANIIAAGGVGSLQDIVQLNSIGVYGVVIGKALYENKINLRDAIEISHSS
jgi:phosphoribosylformimino-5-aminoimidazole carboxamide ribotide isomerase